jgi:hypothetical protein
MSISSGICVPLVLFDRSLRPGGRAVPGDHSAAETGTADENAPGVRGALERSITARLGIDRLLLQNADVVRDDLPLIAA